ncbi:MAG: alpha/beta hydrolase [Gammaproteobacteria bacterium]|nr:alpha/beta hydrolase [Gammaproteobacteria bacterium]HCL72960.1 alpha/beta hydrolase [Gammaproteobacteria bacterium]
MIKLTAIPLSFRKYSDDGPALLVLHGLFGSQANWGWHCKQFAEHFSVYGVDLRNHGDSPHAAEFNYPVMADDVAALIVDLGLQDCVILGHSMGGKVGMELALTQPNLIKRLLVVDIAPVSYPEQAEGHLRVIAGMKALPLESIASRREAEEFLRDYIIDEPTRKFVLTNLQRRPEGGFRWRLNLAAIDASYDALRVMPAHAGSFEKPTLFVKGAESAYIQSSHKEEILSLFPDSDVKIIMGAGHWLHADKPQAFKKIAMDFLCAGA